MRASETRLADALSLIGAAREMHGGDAALALQSLAGAIFALACALERPRAVLTMVIDGLQGARDGLPIPTDGD